jgi:hypothetical protein
LCAIHASAGALSARLTPRSVYTDARVRMPSYTTRISDSQLMHRDASDNRDALMTSPQIRGRPDNSRPVAIGPYIADCPEYRVCVAYYRATCDMCQKTICMLKSICISYIYIAICDKIVTYRSERHALKNAATIGSCTHDRWTALGMIFSVVSDESFSSSRRSRTSVLLINHASHASEVKPGEVN